MLNINSILNFNSSNKIVFLRVDFNVPIDENSKIIDSKRIDEVIPTILHIMQNNNKLVICSHFGRPKYNIDEKFSLKNIFKYLQLKLENIKIHFVDNLILNYDHAINNVNFGEIVFLENIRFYEGEEANSREFKEFLAKFDIYCNEAFSCSHRAHSSIMLSELFEDDKKFCGLLFEKEIKSLDNFINSEKNLISTAVIGGSKISTKLLIIEQLMHKVDNLIIVGAMANTLLRFIGNNIGKSLVEDDCDEICKKILSNQKCRIILPDYIIVTDNLKNPTRIEKKNIKDLNNDDIVVDIGEESVFDFIEIIENSDMLLWNGPFGLFEVKPFDQGTTIFAQNVIELTKKGKIKSIIGGGDTLSAVSNFDLNDFTHASTAGGAFLEYIELNGGLIGIKPLIAKKSVNIEYFL